LHRMLEKIDWLCAERDLLKSPTQGRVLGGRNW
jgi:hypothetical protein